MGALWPGVCYCFWDGGVGPLVQTTADLLGSNERLDSAGQGGILGNMDTGNDFCSCKMIACYSATKGKKKTKQNYYLAWIISF